MSLLVSLSFKGVSPRGKSLPDEGGLSKGKLLTDRLEKANNLYLKKLAFEAPGLICLPHERRKKGERGKGEGREKEPRRRESSNDGSANPTARARVVNTYLVPPRRRGVLTTAAAFAL